MSCNCTGKGKSPKGRRSMTSGNVKVCKYRHAKTGLFMHIRSGASKRVCFTIPTCRWPAGAKMGRGKKVGGQFMRCR